MKGKAKIVVRWTSRTTSASSRARRRMRVRSWRIGSEAAARLRRAEKDRFGLGPCSGPSEARSWEAGCSVRGLERGHSVLGTGVDNDTSGGAKREYLKGLLDQAVYS